MSYTRTDGKWAEWIAWQLEAAGYRVTIQAWDFDRGSHFVREMHRAAATADRTIAVVSAAYLNSAYAEAEWQAAWAADPSGTGRKLIPIRVEDCPRPGLLDQLVGDDLFGLDPEAAVERLLAIARGGRGKPATEPRFPGHCAAVGTTPEPGFPGQLPHMWKAPGRNRNFTGRERLLAAIRTSLREGRPVAVTALHGLAGVGKTQLAAEYAHRYADEYSLVWWIDADQIPLIGEKIAALADPLGLSSDGPASDLATAVLAALTRRTGWLVVFDNAEDPVALRNWLPDGPGQVLITSRNPAWGALADPIAVGVFERAESSALLNRRLPGHAPAVVDTLAAELGDLPLALAQAAGYIATTGTDPAGYLAKFRARRTALLAKGDDPLYHGTVATAWSMALDRLQAEAPATVQLLQLCALLAPEPIPLTLFSDRPELLESPLADACTDGHVDLDLDEVIGAARQYSWVGRTGNMIQLHRLVQGVIADSGRRAPHSDAICRTAITLLSGMVDSLHPELPADWPQYWLLTPHLAALCHQAAVRAVDSRHVDRLLHSVAATVSAHGRSGTFAAGEALACASLDILAHLGGEQALLRVHHELAWHVAQRRPARAEQIHLDVLAARRRLLGDDHPDTLASRQEVAWIAGVQRQWPDAEKQYREVFDARRRVLGLDDSETLISWHELAWAIANQSRYDEAEWILHCVLKARRKVVGDHHLRTLTTQHELAWIAALTGRWSQAEAGYRRLLGARRRLLGHDHPETLVAWQELAWVLAKQGRHGAALTEYQAVLEAREQTQGDEHPDVVETRRRIELLQLGRIPQPPVHLA
ncbi:FxSxx-COOH system tetratricopeptide repeat protein [Frankia sp. AiPs1]|nr:FxSxx-COOH system tetratricopeptide repeat protein [Frankia sp. AiPs1]MCM3923259.1 FxSxx-COOH system tetratricopeptide repeat protein [Frankia sp. AiPs1]